MKRAFAIAHGRLAEGLARVRRLARCDSGATSIEYGMICALIFLAIIMLGGIALSLPFAAAPGRHVAVIDAFFTSVSAVCVTGLVVLDTPVDFSPFGQVVVMLLIQLGGLGYMTLSTVFAAALGRGVTIQERLTLQEALNVQDMEGLVRFAGTVDGDGVLTLDTGKITLGPLPVALGQPGIIPPKSPTGCL